MFNHAAAIGADIGHYYIKIAVVKNDGEIIAVKSYPLVQKQTRDYLIGKILEAVMDIRQVVAVERINPICIGISAKGFIDHRSGIILGPDQGIKDWLNVPRSCAGLEKYCIRCPSHRYRRRDNH
jgi:predicted NBD/HSP70 family sugar kinase